MIINRIFIANDNNAFYIWNLSDTVSYITLILRAVNPNQIRALCLLYKTQSNEIQFWN